MKRFLLLLLLPFVFYGQKQEIVSKYLSKVITSEYQAFSDDIHAQALLAEQRISQYLAANPTAQRSFYKNGSYKEIIDVDDSGQPFYYTTYNFNSGITMRTTELYEGGSLNLDLEGQDMVAGVWDGGVARFSHTEIVGRMLVMDGSSMGDHPSHVTGTMIATGINPLLRGIAPQGSVRSYSFANDLPEMTTAFQIFGLLTSNHSYGPDADSSPLWLFGAYNNQARNLDQLLFNSEFYLPVYAAGNDRDNFTTHNPTKNGFDLVGSSNSAKNIITVGAVNQVLNYTGPTSVSMSSFSNWGPTDDGRIKPDVVAKGTSVRSLLSNSDVGNGNMQGTSMAAPAVTGVAMLLQQHYINLHEEPMYAATLKGLILHTADECGLFDGPDYRFGWGLVNAQKAVELITSQTTDQAIVSEEVLQNTSTYSTTINVVDESEPLAVSISWTDAPPTIFNSGTVDLPNLMLVNDLDIRLTKDGETFFPWSLNLAAPQFPALNTEDNFRDNFEKIEIPNPTVGAYTLTVTHKGNLVGGEQKFSVVASGGIDQTLSNNDFFTSNVKIYPNPASEIIRVENFSNEIVITQVNIYDFTGKNVLSTSSFETIDVSNFSNGVYLIEVVTKSDSFTQKFIKK